MSIRRAIDLLALDVRHACRGLRTDRIFAATAVATVAISVGLTASIFTIADGILFRPLPYGHADRLVVPYLRAADGQVLGTLDANAAAAFEAARAFDAVAYWQPDFVEVVAESDELVRLSATAVGQAFLETLGVDVLLGRSFAPDDFHAGPERPVLLMHPLWKRLGGNAAIVGQTVRLEERSVRVIGVLPASFVFPTWLPQPDALTPKLGPDVLRAGNFALPVARLRPDVTARQASAELRALVRAALSGGDRRPSEISVQSLRSAMFGSAQRVLSLLLLATLFVLVIACVNLASLLLARGTERQRELAVRAAIGATRGRLARQLIVESLVLAAFGGVVGLLLSIAAFEYLHGQVPGALYRLLPAGVDARVLLFTLAVSIASGLMFGVVPAIQLSASDLKAPLQSARGFGAARLSWRGEAILVATEVALVVVLLASAGLTLRSFARLMQVDVGVDPAGVSLLTLNLPRSRYAPSQAYGFSSELVAHLRRLPGIEAVAGLYAAPVGGAAGWSAADLPNAPTGAVQTWPVQFGHFETFAIAVRAGRTFSEAEVAANAPVVVLSERAARIGWPNGDAIGQVIQFRGDQLRRIVGIVGDVRSSRQRLGPATAYVPLHFNLLPRGVTEIAVRSGRDGAVVREMLLAEVRRSDDSVRASVRTFPDLLATQIAIPRFQVQLFSLLGLIGLTLAICGLLGVVQYLVSRRAREIGIRIALGARAAQVRVMVLRQALTPVIAGLAVGLLVASGATRALEPWLFETSPRDPMTLAAASVLMIVVAAVAAYLPAQRAARLNPIDAIRVE